MSPLETDQGLNVCASIRDATERHEAAALQAAAIEREREASRRLREVDLLRSDFLSTVSHELRTPLTAIKGFAEILVDGWDTVDDGRRREFVERIHRAGSRLDALIEDLLDFSRLERGQLNIELAPHSVAKLVRDVLKQMGQDLAGHQVVVDLPEALRALADRTAFVRVLSNLLTNAAKFAEQGTAIVITGQQHDGEVQVSVQDHGVGIAPEHHARVFERFRRVAESSGQPGTGIGLAIVKEFVEAQSGTVSLRSARGEGSTFTLHLRAAEPAATP